MFEKKYIVYLVVLGLLVVALLSFVDKGENWQITFYKKDKNPFGGYVLHQLIQDGEIFRSYGQSNRTLYEMKDDEAGNYLILCESFFPSQDDIEAMVEMLGRGKNIMVMAHSFSREFADTLGINTANRDIQVAEDSFFGKDSLSLEWGNIYRYQPSKFYYPAKLVSYYFDSVDKDAAEVVIKNGKGDPVVVSIRKGRGKLILGTVPLTFTNFGILYRDNHTFVSSLLSYLGENDICFADYYQVGRLESASPLRYILSVPSWQAAVYLFLIVSLLFVLFESKRRQKAIPVVEPLKNTTLDFTKTIGRLYYQKKNHKDLLDKKVLYFKDHLRQNYHIDWDARESSSLTDIAGKLGRDEKDVERLMKELGRVEKMATISENDLIRINNLIENFYNR